MVDQTNVPTASGLDEWWRTAASSADIAEREKRAIAAEDFQAHRRWHYYNTGQEVGGWARPSAMGRCHDYGKWPRMINWT